VVEGSWRLTTAGPASNWMLGSGNDCGRCGGSLQLTRLCTARCTPASRRRRLSLCLSFPSPCSCRGGCPFLGRLRGGIAPGSGMRSQPPRQQGTGCIHPRTPGRQSPRVVEQALVFIRLCATRARPLFHAPEPLHLSVDDLVRDPHLLPP